MVNLNKMYDGVVNSPETYLTQNLAADATIIYVADSSVFGSLPNLAVIGTDQNAETILIKSKRSDGGLEVQRALEGPAKRWEKTTAIARNFTNFDYQQIKDNIEKLNTGKQDSLTAGSNIKITNGRISATDTKYNDTQIKKDIAELQNSQLSKASQTEAESGVDNTKYMTPQATKQAIEKLSPKQDLSGYAKETDIKSKLSEMVEDSTHRTVTDTEKKKWNKKFDLPTGKENQVLTKTTNGAEFKEISSSRSATFVIANYDSSENSKAGADYVIRENESPCDVINSFIEKLPSYGGKIQLTEGHFIEKNDKSINLNKDNITLSGYGQSTKLERTIENVKIEFIKIFNSNIILEDLQSNPKNENAVWFSENTNKCKIINIVGTSTNNPVFSINGSNHQFSNCTGTSTNGSVFWIKSSNHQLSNCSGTSTSRNAFSIDGSNNSLSNCSGTSPESAAFWIVGSNNSLSNCSGTSGNNGAFNVEGSNNSLSNCIGTSTTASPFYITGSGISLVGCSATGKDPHKYHIFFNDKSKLCVALANRYSNGGLGNQGTNNVLANNIKLEV